MITVNDTNIDQTKLSDEDLYFHYITGVPEAAAEMSRRIAAEAAGVTFNNVEPHDDVFKEYTEELHPRDAQGHWTTGISTGLSGWNPADGAPASPKNAGGMTARTWKAWETGTDGNAYTGYMQAKACEMLGLPVPAGYNEKDYYLNNGMGAPSAASIEGMINAIANSKEQPDLYRGMGNQDPKWNADSVALMSQLKDMKTGDTLDMPLTSTTRSPGVGFWYADSRNSGDAPPVVIKIQQGANGVAVGENASFFPQDKEVVVNGKFEVVNSSVISMPYWARDTAPINAPGTLSQDETGYAIRGPSDETKAKVSSDLAGQIYQALNENPKADLSKFNTPDMQVTNDHFQPVEDPGGWGRIVSIWHRQTATDFHVIELKQSEVYKVGQK